MKRTSGSLAYHQGVALLVGGLGDELAAQVVNASERAHESRPRPKPVLCVESGAVSAIYGMSLPPSWWAVMFCVSFERERSGQPCGADSERPELFSAGSQNHREKAH